MDSTHALPHVNPVPGPGCRALVEISEGCAERQPDGTIKAYLDTIAHPPVWTIGWGTTGHDVVEGTIWTQQQADSRLTAGIAREWAALALHIAVSLNQNQVDALADLAYETGADALIPSSLLGALNLGQYAQVPWHLFHTDPDGAPHGWIMAGGVPVRGMILRRQREIALWNTPL